MVISRQPKLHPLALALVPKQDRKWARTGEWSARRQTSTVWTGGKPGGRGRKSRPGRLTLRRVAVVGAMPKPAEMSHILVWISLVYWAGRGRAPALPQAARKAS